MNTLADLDIPADDAVATHLKAAAEDGTVGAERVLRARLDQPASPRPQDYLNVAKDAPVALRIDIDTLERFVRHVGHISSQPWETIAVRDGDVEPDVTRRTSKDLRDQIDWQGATVVRNSGSLQAMYNVADDGGDFL